MRNIISFICHCHCFCHSFDSFTLVIMVQMLRPSLSSPSESSNSNTGAGLLARLQVASLQSKDNDRAGFSGPPVSSSSVPFIPSLKNESPILSTLNERSVEDEITNGKRSGSQLGESFLEEVVLDTNTGLKSFSGHIGVTASVEIIFEDLSPVTAPVDDQFASSLESMGRPRVEFGEQGGLEGQAAFGRLSSSSEIQLRDCSVISVPSRFIRTPSVKRETRRVTVKWDMDPQVKLCMQTRSGGIVGFAKIHACVDEGCNMKKHAIKEHQLLTDRIHIRNSQVGGVGVYLHPSVVIHEVNEDFLRSLLTQERTVDAWSSLLSRLPSLDKESKDQSKLVESIDQFSLRDNFLIPHMKQKKVVKSLSDNKVDFDFNDEVFADTADPSSFVSSWSSLLERLELLS